METIYINCEKAKNTYEKISDCSNIINSDIKKINELLDDLKRYWISNESNNFCSALEDYNNTFLEISKELDENSDNLKRCVDSYQSVDERYSSELM